ncbi:MAG: RNA methyltransferase [Candidatus Nanohaloarchaeota archaeon QJJ-9]|nr:RNA methyltransferase [Candidatus Nanohaloarchaeota archaeon QJJ-9]
MYKCVVVEPEIEGNLGFLARTMENFGIEELILVNPDFQISEKARQKAMHAQDMIDKAKIVESLEKALEEVNYAVGTTGHNATKTNILRNSVAPEEVAKKASEVEGNVGIVLGRESKGLTNKELEKCDLVSTIPTSEDYQVMNITHAAAVYFYELFKHSGTKEKKGKASGREEKQVLENIFKDMMNSVDYSEEEQEKMTHSFNNMLGRAMVYKNEVNALIGSFKKIKSKLGEK